MIGAAYLAPEGLEATLQQELERGGVTLSGWHGRLALSPDPPIHAAWALDIWTAPEMITVASIKKAADALRARQRNWCDYQALLHRRAALIAARLPPVRPQPMPQPFPAPTSHLGAWTLLAQDLMLASTTKTSPFINGECAFEEDHIGPPSRAYLKLWEALVHLGRWPAAGETCLDLGAAPGGWTYALAMLGATVVAVDKAPLDPAVASLSRVTQRIESAFALAPEPVDWLFSDVVAYPDRLLSLVRRWIDDGRTGQVICTVKFQGETDHAAAAAFAAIPGAALMHLWHNRHELTFFWPAPSRIRQGATTQPKVISAS
jgi:23S rRNA (cytidine2498-2'-O)-methyltransferase